MTSRNQKRLAVWPPLLLLCAATEVAAVEEAGDTIDEIQVTATRRATSVADVSAALSIISAEEIAGNKLTTDALAVQPGVYLQQTTPGQGAAIIRGLKGSEILHIVDGFRLNNAIFRNAPTQYLALVSPGAVERIEVVRGAPTSLYGSDAVGGVVQVISRVPEFASAESQARRDIYLATDTGEQGTVGRALVEYGNRDIAGLVSAEFLSAGDRRTGGGEVVTPTAYESYGVRAALSITPSTASNWLVDFQFARQPSTPRVDELNPGYGETEPASSEFRFAPNERYFAHVRNTRTDSWLSADWSFAAGWQRIVDDRVSRNYESIIRRHEHNQSDLYGVLASVSKDTGRGSWIAGMEYYHDGVTSKREEEDIAGGPRQVVPSRFPDGATMDQAAVYANVLHRVGERQTLSGGARFSAIGSDVPAAGSARQDDISADLGYLFDINEKWSLTANLGHGFRAPNIFDLGTFGERPGNRFNIPNSELQSERVTQLDVGMRRRGDAWEGTLSVYRLRYVDRISSVLTGVVTPGGRDVVQSQNIDSADIYGFEGSFDWFITDSLSTSMVLNFTRGEQTEGAAVVSADRIPPLNGRASVRYDGQNDWYLDAFLQFASEQSRLSPRDVRDPRINPDGTAGWGTLNATVQWQPNNYLRLGLNFLNLLDRKYRVHGSGVDAVGRSLGVSVQVSW